MNWFRRLFTPAKPFRHRLAQERMELADHLDTLEFLAQCHYLESLPADLYESWITEPYPGPGDVQ